ncbi:MsnO8 family LLM class oxidoreductase [Kocuria turfanensis]|uniref:Methylene-tetrahydromethanopterin reductase n=1 Tax=Kocuria turfanensis TaxID=388357 RepID=A0A512ICL5_9MICC|nr:MsnO8 family LLM class oxidoreductase [Kocuria turfanensis]GEO95432.1 methylene-tetrahydromethanopterin reductase [Kocuria turfanensis]
MPLSDVALSLLDRASTRRGSTEAEALARVLDRAQRAEELGYHRFWVAEHHGVPGIAGSAPAVLMAAAAARTRRIRIGSGGVMLPNHQPLVVAEQAATLQALHPGRIDLGVGRSLGFTAAVRDALRTGKEAADRFGADLAELLAHLSGTAAVTARPRDHAATPVFVLATGAGVDVAARAGLAVVLGGPALFRPGPEGATAVLERYRERFRPSSWWPQPYVVVSANVAVAGTREAARRLLLPEARALAVSRTRGEFPPLEPAGPADPQALPDRERRLVEESLAASVHGTAPEVRAGLERLVARTGADELLVTGGAYDLEAQAESDRRLAALFALRPR